MTVAHRPSMEAVLLACAYAMSRRSTCPNLQVGVVIALDLRIMSTGYNGAPRGLQHCTHPSRVDVPDQPPCVTTVHAEANAVAFAAREGINLGGATVFGTHSPCRTCAQLLVGTGVVRYVALDRYHDGSGIDVLEAAKIEFEVRRTPVADLLGM